MNRFLAIMCLGTTSSFVSHQRPAMLSPQIVGGTRPIFSFRLQAAPIDCYQVLGVNPTANDAEIKRAYRRAATKYHPDVNKEAGANERFSEVCQAYETLKNPQSRAKHDRSRGFGSSQQWGKSSSYSSSSSSQKAPSSAYSTGRRKAEVYENPKDIDDSFGAIFGDLFGAVARTGVGVAAGAAVGGATGGFGGAVRGGVSGAGVGGGVGGLLEDLVSFLEAQVDGFGTESEGFEFDEMLRTAPLSEIEAEVEAGETLLAALAKRQAEASELKNVAQKKLDAFLLEKTQRQAGGRRLELSDLEREAKLTGNAKGLGARLQELQGHKERAQRRQRRLEIRLAELRSGGREPPGSGTGSSSASSASAREGGTDPAGKNDPGKGSYVPPHRQPRERGTDESRRRVESELEQLKREMGM